MVDHPALSLSEVSKRFGGLQVLENLTFAVARGSVHGLIGPNGAGKTTAINIAMGHYRPDSGSIRLGGEDVTHLATHARARKGLARTFQGGRLFDRLDGRTNIRIAVEQRRRAQGISLSRSAVGDDVEQLISAGDLRDIAGEIVGNLPYGRQKQIEMARAVAFAQTALLLDEPTAGLSNSEIDTALQLVLGHRDRLAILIIEHNMDVVMSICDGITVIDAGRHLATGTPDEIQRNQGVIDAYLGG